jgi:hypothetical protein
MDAKKSVTTSGIGATPLTRQPVHHPIGQPKQIAPQPVDDLLIQWLRQMRQPVPTVQAAPPAPPPVQSESGDARVSVRTQLSERRWFTAQNSPAKASAALKPLPVGRRKKGASSWAQWSGLLPLMLPQAMRRMRQALWRETQRVSRLTMARWRQHQHRRREGRRRK